ncbi:very long-chain specific acyl-CoA dehydrogenase, mitochondrial-like [Trichosurus vulpecula]|uniref:very long-chain specific acyl-CoA dehydrogenase, mitochondrial-like n=1 Tax=Trichosurus vulpecula TaxID=9337 RepID=UPI00186B1B27|nr:very long-chain specific acyl-CoA dehydrogenase, mitochondrial-like [Trichosurus vulpecula]
MAPTGRSHQSLKLLGHLEDLHRRDGRFREEPKGGPPSEGQPLTAGGGERGLQAWNCRRSLSFEVPASSSPLGQCGSPPLGDGLVHGDIPGDKSPARTRSELHWRGFLALPCDLGPGPAASRLLVPRLGGCSNGGIADVFTVFAKTQVKDVTTGEVHGKISAFIVEKEFEGVTSGPPERKMGIRASNTTSVIFNNVKVPTENVLGGFGNGFKVAMSILNNGRFGTVSAMAGTMRRMIKKAANHAAKRKQFGKQICDYGIIQEKLARMAMYHYVAESMAYLISGNMDTKVPDFHLEAALSKVFASEAAWEVADECIQILGGAGYMKKARVEQIMRDLRIFRILEGTNDILRIFVALAGLQHAGAQLEELQHTLEDPLNNSAVLFTELGLRAKRIIGIPTGISLDGVVSGHLLDTASLVTKCVDLLSEAVEHLLLKFGTEVVYQQFHLRRVADTAMDIYSMGVVLSRATQSLNHNLPSATHEKLLCESWCYKASERVRWNLRSVKASSWNSYYQNMKTISNEVVRNGGVIYSRPMGF